LADPSSAAPAQERAEERSFHVCPARGDGSVPDTLIRVYDARKSFESPDVHICLRLASGTFAATSTPESFSRSSAERERVSLAAFPSRRSAGRSRRLCSCSGARRRAHAIRCSHSCPRARCCAMQLNRYHVSLIR